MRWERSVSANLGLVDCLDNKPRRAQSPAGSCFCAAAYRWSSAKAASKRALPGPLLWGGESSALSGTWPPAYSLAFQCLGAPWPGQGNLGDQRRRVWGGHRGARLDGRTWDEALVGATIRSHQSVAFSAPHTRRQSA